MKKIVLFALAAMPVVAMGQQYKVEGKAPEGATVVYLQNLETSRETLPDSVVLKGKRTFVFSGDSNGQKFAVVYTDRKFVDAVPVILDGAVAVDIDARKSAGTVENQQLTAAMVQLQPWKAELAKLEEEAKNLQMRDDLTPETIQSFRERYGVADGKYVAAVRDICDANQQAIFPAHLIRELYLSLERADMIRWADGGAAFMNVSLLARLKQSVAGWKRQELGALFTDLEEADTLGVVHKLSEYVGKGNYVLVDFWASWCGPCIAEMPNVKAAYEKYHPKGLDIVGLSFDQKKEQWVGAIRRLDLPWHHLSDLKGWGTVAATTYGINFIPAMLLFDPEGKVVANSLHGEKLQEKLKEIYGE